MPITKGNRVPGRATIVALAALVPSGVDRLRPVATATVAALARVEIVRPVIAPVVRAQGVVEIARKVAATGVRVRRIVAHVIVMRSALLAKRRVRRLPS
jgi:hypothetical protein